MRINDSKGISNNYMRVQEKREINKQSPINFKDVKLVNISDEGKKIARKIVEEEEVNEEKLNKIKNDILKGNYQVSPEKIADRLIEKLRDQGKSED